MRLWRRYRSAGVRVDATVHRLISAGNVARDRRELSVAAARYREALDRAPELAHVHVQLGHVLKLDRHWVEAEAAYREALQQKPGDRDAGLALGHLLKEQGRWIEAAASYVELASANPADAEAIRESRDSIGRTADPERRRHAERLLAALPPIGLDATAVSDGEPLATCDLVLDVSDLIAFFSYARHPTGIQRVQIETLINLVTGTMTDVPTIGVCCFIDGRDEWVAVPWRPIFYLARMSLLGNDNAVEWNVARDRLHLQLLIAERAEMKRGAGLISLGSAGWRGNYFLHLRAAQADYGIIYIPMVYDIIPTITPRLFTDALVQDFVAWALSIFAHTDRFLTISEATKRDLVALANRLGTPIDPTTVKVIPLDGRYSSVSDASVHLPTPLANGQPFVLIVGTIEPRKGHLFAFDAWQRLIDDHGPSRVPLLVCVGRNGWRNAAIYARLIDDPALAERVIILSDVDDRLLTALYDRCLFTIYPSLYEGWGLPVTESLCRGKMVITTSGSSLPEAGGRWAVYVDAGNAAALAEAAATLIFDDERRRAGEARIAESFAPRGWPALCSDICSKAEELRCTALPQSGAPPTTASGLFQWIGRSMALETRPGEGRGEAFRAGCGWQSPEPWGCRVAAEGGELSFRYPPPAMLEPMDVLVRLVGSRDSRCSFSLRAGDQELSGVLGRDERRSIRLPIPLCADGGVTIAITGSTANQDEDRELAGHSTSETIGVEGFALLPRSTVTHPLGVESALQNAHR